MEAEIVKAILTWIGYGLGVLTLAGLVIFVVEMINAPLMDASGQHYLDADGNVISKEESRKIKHPILHVHRAERR